MYLGPFYINIYNIYAQILRIFYEYLSCVYHIHLLEI